ncbi:MAG: hypothetical protein CSA33_02155 [Desulfobulbus propionicus]|nr:MAG: hypothetical protein CSA33_02155 [Desulfobulbus propionicus]
MTEKNQRDERIGAETAQPHHDGNQEQKKRDQRDSEKYTPSHHYQGAPEIEQTHHQWSSNVPGYTKGVLRERKLLTIRDLLYIFFKHLRAITIITAVCLLTAATYAFFVTPRYMAETKILVKLGRENLSDLNEYSRNINILHQRRNQDVNNELEIFKSDELTKMVYQDLETDLVALFPQKAPGSIAAKLADSNSSFENKMLLFLKNSLEIRFLAETDILKLSFSSTDPEFAATAVKAYADAFVRLRTKIYETKKSHQFYVDQIDMYRKRVNDLVEEEKEYCENHNISLIDKEKELVLQNRDEQKTQLAKARQKLDRINALVSGLQTLNENPASWIETPKINEEEMVDRQAYLQDIDRQYFTLKLERAQLIGFHTEESREIKQIDQNIMELRAQKYLSLRNILELNRATVEKKIDNLSSEIAKKNKRLRELIQATYMFEHFNLSRNVALDTLVNYQKRAESLRIYEDLDKHRITSLRTISAPTVPIHPYFPKKNFIMLVALFFGIFISFGLSAVKEFFTHIFRDGQDIETILDVPLLLTIGNRE